MLEMTETAINEYQTRFNMMTEGKHWDEDREEIGRLFGEQLWKAGLRWLAGGAMVTTAGWSPERVEVYNRIYVVERLNALSREALEEAKAAYLLSLRMGEAEEALKAGLAQEKK